jgi:hypothetical protein
MTGHFQPFGDSRECLWSKTASIGGHIDLVCARYTVHKPWVVDQYYALMSSRNLCAVRTRRRDQQATAMLAAACPDYGVSDYLRPIRRTEKGHFRIGGRVKNDPRRLGLA